MAGRVCIVTGATSGIGRETARGLARLGATVVLAVRNPGKGEAVRDDLARTAGNEDVHVIALDLTRQSSVRSFASTFRERFPRLDVLVNNAGIYTAKLRLTEDGIESTFATNHLSHFLLTNLFLDVLRRTAPSRIVNVSSGAHHFGAIHFDDLNLSRRWSGWAAYCQSKLANVVFTAELARRLRGTGVTANAMHPGTVRTNFARNDGGWMGVAARLAAPFLISAAKGADTAIYLASSPDVDGVSGEYFFRRRRTDPKPIARDPDVARRLWERSEALSGLRPKL